MATGIWPAATAAADPADDPPGLYSRLCGLRVAAGSMKAKGVVAVFPRITAPAAFSRDTSTASHSGWQPASATLPHSVGMSAVSMMSFRPIGTP